VQPAPPPAGGPPSWPPPPPYIPGPPPGYTSPPPGWTRAPPRDDTHSIVALLGVIVIVTVLIAVAIVVIFFLSISGVVHVTVTGANFEVNYAGAATGYFGPTSQSGCSECPITVLAGQGFTVSFTLVNSAVVAPHSVNDITVSSPFQLVSTTPVAPFSVPAGNSVTVTLHVDASTLGGSYVMQGVIDVS
jgi:hypothetical protein